MVGVSLAATCALGGCGASLGGLRSGEAATFAEQKAIVVLLRLIARTATGDPVDLLGGVDSLSLAGYGQFFILVEDIDTGVQTKVTRPRSLTQEAARQGWVHLVLAPGRYFLRIQTHLHGPVSGRFTLRVPRGHAVIYAGSLPLTCRKKGWFEAAFSKQGVTPECSVPAAVVDESQLAVEFGGRALSTHPQPVTVLMTVPDSAGT